MADDRNELSCDVRALNQMASAFAAIEAARTYGFSIEAALEAAVAQLQGLRERDVLLVAALLAAFAAMELRPIGGDLGRWVEERAFHVAMKERPQ